MAAGAPKLRASYEAAQTTERLFCQATITGLPAADYRAAPPKRKNASMSTLMIFRTVVWRQYYFRRKQLMLSYTSRLRHRRWVAICTMPLQILEGTVRTTTLTEGLIAVLHSVHRDTGGDRQRSSSHTSSTTAASAIGHV